MRAAKIFVPALLLAAIILMLSGCAEMKQGIESLPGIKLSPSDTQSVIKTTKALRKSFSDITEEEEYYIGRSVSALILSKYSVYNNDVVTRYVNTVGNAVVIYSDRPEIYAGYHFLVLDSDEVNALAAPGGFIFITRGLLKRCVDEEMLAGILAHEVGHVSAKHGLRSIKKSRLIDAFKIMGQEAAAKYGPDELSQLSDVFEDVLGDISERLIERGYDRKYEYEADRLSVKFTSKTGYDPNGLVDFLKTMVDDSSKDSTHGWFKTHPSAKDRLNRARKEISALKTVPQKVAVRTTRFKEAVKLLK